MDSKDYNQQGLGASSHTLQAAMWFGQKIPAQVAVRRGFSGQHEGFPIDVVPVRRRLSLQLAVSLQL